MNDPLAIFGDFVRWIPSLIVQSELVFATARSLVDGLVTCANRSPEHINRSRESTGAAISRIRSALAKPEPSVSSSELLLSIRMMYLVEVSLKSDPAKS